MAAITQRIRRLGAQILGLILLLLTLVVVLGSAGTGWTFREPCETTNSDAQALFDYMSFYSCAEVLPATPKAILLLVWLALLISLLATTADIFFVPQLSALSSSLKLPEDVAGVTLLALGNGMPDVMTATSSINKADDFALALGEIFGAANWILSLVLGCVLLCHAGPVRVDPYPFLRDAAAYAGVVAIMLIFTWDGSISLLETLSFFVFYALYVLVVVVPSRFRRVAAREALQVELTSARPARLVIKPPSMLDEYDDPDARSSHVSLEELEDLPFTRMDSDSDTSDTPGNAVEDPLEGLDANEVEGTLGWLQFVMELPFTLARHLSIPAATWNRKRRRLAVVCPPIGLMITLLSYGGPQFFEKHWGSVPLWVLWMAFASIFTGIICCFSTEKQQPKWHNALLLMAFVYAIGWFNLLANECVAVLETLGLNFGISSSVLGITVLAWGNSVGDLVADTALAKQGKARTAVAGCFGSPLLSDLLGLGVALSSHTMSNGPLEVRLSFENRIGVAFLLASMGSSVSAFVASGFCCPRWFGWVLLVQYASFLGVSVLVETGILFAD